MAADLIEKLNALSAKEEQEQSTTSQGEPQEVHKESAEVHESVDKPEPAKLSFSKDELEALIKEQVSAALKASKPEVKSDSKPKSDKPADALTSLAAQVKSHEDRWQKSRAKILSSSLSAELAKNKVLPEVVPVLSKYFADKVRFSSDDSDDLVYVEGDSEMPMAEALSSILQLESYQVYLEPKNTASGTGTRASKSAAKSVAQMTEVEKQNKKIFGF